MALVGWRTYLRPYLIKSDMWSNAAALLIPLAIVIQVPIRTALVSIPMAVVVDVPVRLGMGKCSGGR